MDICHFRLLLPTICFPSLQQHLDWVHYWELALLHGMSSWKKREMQAALSSPQKQVWSLKSLPLGSFLTALEHIRKLAKNLVWVKHFLLACWFSSWDENAGLYFLWNMQRRWSINSWCTPLPPALDLVSFLFHSHIFHPGHELLKKQKQQQNPQQPCFPVEHELVTSASCYLQPEILNRYIFKSVTELLNDRSL